MILVMKVLFFALYSCFDLVPLLKVVDEGTVGLRPKKKGEERMEFWFRCMDGMSCELICSLFCFSGIPSLSIINYLIA